MNMGVFPLTRKAAIVSRMMTGAYRRKVREGWPECLDTFIVAALGLGVLFDSKALTGNDLVLAWKSARRWLLPMTEE